MGKEKRNSINCIAIMLTIAYNKEKGMILEGGDIMATKTANLYARIEPDVKEQAEHILSTLGIPVSNAINMFYKQIILQRGLPFEVKIPYEYPLNIAHMTEAQLNEELEKGYQSILAGRTISAEQAFKELEKEFNI
ncbi:MAG: type II toxin-antitoxin system RelB/DinJ family antitoxin [Phascolarctobacterium sp.]|nr:type II toxin-antitoxin system RelB/DinJ family antitoxin [Phascolarctobacterium sp.]